MAKKDSRRRYVGGKTPGEIQDEADDLCGQKDVKIDAHSQYVQNYCADGATIRGVIVDLGSPEQGWVTITKKDDNTSKSLHQCMVGPGNHGTELIRVKSDEYCWIVTATLKYIRR